MAMSVPGNSCRPCTTISNGCVLTTDKVCYSGPPITRFGIAPGDTVTTALQKISTTSGVTTVDGVTVDFSGAGTAASPLTAEIILSPDIGNTLTINSNGLYGANTSEDMFGYRYNASTWSNLTDFVVNGATVSVVSNKLSFSGGTGAFNQSLDVDSGTLLEKFTTSIRFTVSVTGAGVGVGPRSTGGTPRHAIAVLNTTTGYVSIYVLSAPLLVATSSAPITFNNTDVIELVLQQDGMVLLASARNVTTGASAATAQYVYTTAPFTFVNSMPNTGRMAIWSLGGSFSVSSLSWFTPTPKNATLLVVGDSKTKGYYVTGSGERFVDMLDNEYHTTIMSAGGADNLTDVLLRVDEIIQLSPKNVALAIGRNDISLGTPLSTIEANYASLVSQLEAVNINVLHLLGFWETSVNQVPFINWIISTYPASSIIDCYTPTTRTDCLYSDGIHLTTLGDRVIHDTIVEANKIRRTSFSEHNNILCQNYYVQNGTFSINGSGSFTGAASQVNILNQALYNATSNPVIDMSTTWNTTGAPCAIRLAVTDNTSDTTSKVAKWSMNGTDLFVLDKTGKLSLTGTSNGTQITVKLPLAQTITTPVLQLQTSTGTEIFSLRAVGTDNNLFLGPGVGSTITSGTGNMIFAMAGFFGNGGRSITTGSNNVGFGNNVLALNTTGQSNTAIGGQSLISVSTGNQNTALGQAACAFITTGGNNVGIGVNACKGGANIGVSGAGTGGNNVAVGTSALLNNATGSFNVAVGGSALGGVNGTSVSQCVVVGYFACRQNTIGLNNVVLGYSSCTADALGDGNIFIGAGVSVTNTPTNSTLIGTSMTTSISNIVALGRADQNVLVGVTTVSSDNGAKLQVSGDITTSDPNTGIGKWKLGQLKTAASTLDTTRYVEVNIDGTVVKLAVIQ